VRQRRVRLTATFVALIFAINASAAMAHPGHPHNDDGRIPGQPDFQRIGKVEVRFHPELGSYSYKRGPNETPMWFHLDDEVASRSGETSLPATEEPVQCTATGHRIRIMYAYPTGGAPPANQVSEIRGFVRRMASKILSESLRSSDNERGLKMRVECDANGEIKLVGFTSSNSSSEIFTRVDELFGAPSGAGAVKNLVLYYGVGPGGCCGGGVAQAHRDEDKSSSDSVTSGSNDNRVKSATGVVYGGGWSMQTTLHELFHTMGAVQLQAPFATWKFSGFFQVPAFHCTDGIAVMCYPDDSANGDDYTETRCPASSGFDTPAGIPLDCMYDGYFDAGEETGEWLNTHWNAGGIENPYLAPTGAGRPLVVVGGIVSHPSSSSATLLGSINPQGLPTQYYFEYGTTPTFGNKVPIPSGNISSNLYLNHTASHTVTGLLPNTTYYYRLVAANAEGTEDDFYYSFTTPAWDIRTTPNPAGTSNRLHSVSCEPSSTSLCTAVGVSTSSGVDAPVAQRWDGASWSSQAPAKKSGAAHTRLFSVDCPSTTRCIAVGNYEVSGNGSATLAELWNNGSWSVQSTPVPSSATSSELTDVGCNSTANCMAVGSALINGVKTAIAAKWTSPTWAAEPIPIPAEAISSQLDGVDCLWSNFCVAVGRYTASTGLTKSLAIFWNGTNWSLQTPTDPSGATESTLLDVSCTPSPNACMAVGAWRNSAANGSHQQTLAYRVTASSWTLQKTLNPAGSQNPNVFEDVSCAGATSCTAVGSWKWPPVIFGGGSTRTLAEQWNGSSWSVQTTSDPSKATFSSLLGTSCRETKCIAVGWSTDTSGTNTTLAEIRE